jgi:hypothetical protein
MRCHPFRVSRRQFKRGGKKRHVLTESIDDVEQRDLNRLRIAPELVIVHVMQPELEQHDRAQDPLTTPV